MDALDHQFGICRCCLQKGRLKQLWCEYLWMGEKENYGTMLVECFSLRWKDSHLDDLICNGCIGRLRDAYSFRAQVINSEKEMNAQQSQNNFTANSVAKENDYIKIIEEKQASKVISDTDPSIQLAMGSERKRGGEAGEFSTRYKNYSQERLLLSVEAVQMQNMSCSEASRRYQVPCRTIRKKFSKQIDADFQTIGKGDPYIFREEIKTLLSYTNAVPFKLVHSILCCAYCNKEFEDPDEMRRHTTAVHDDDRISKIDKIMKPEYQNETLRIDIENLQCTHCKLRISWHEVYKHLEESHQVIFKECQDTLLPFYLQTNGTVCVMCEDRFPNYAQIDKHMNMHFKNYICQECGDTFVSLNRFRTHKSIHRTGKYSCSVCGKVFNTDKYLQKHTKSVHLQEEIIKCRYCTDRFSSYYARHKHVIKVHRERVREIACEICGKTYSWKPHYNAHLKKDHGESKKK